MPTLFRGIAVAPNDLGKVVDSIRQVGFQQPAQWENKMPDPVQVRTRAEDWIRNPATARSEMDLLPSQPLVYACGDLYGASWYALHHNNGEENTRGIVIEFEAPWEALCIDGKDFLYTAFQFCEANKRNGRLRSALVGLFGEQIVRYFDPAASTSEHKERIGLCDLACYDLGVIRSHHANRCLIAGRSQTQFCSSFQLQLPVTAQAIKRVDASPSMPKAPSSPVRLSDLIH